MYNHGNRRITVWIADLQAASVITALVVQDVHAVQEVNETILKS